MKLDELWLKTRRGVLYALYLIGALLVQNVILSHVALFGVRAMFLPALVVAAALFLAAFAQMFSLLFYEGQSSAALWVTALLQTLWSLPFLFPSYYLCKNFPWRSSRDVPTPYK